MRASDERPVFHAGLGGYKVFRIPVLLNAGPVLLAFAEGRPSLRDHGRIEIVLRRSLDSGQSWSALQVVPTALPLVGRRRTDMHYTIGNPTPIFLAREHMILLLFCSNGATAAERAIRARAVGAAASRRVWLSNSSDRGGSWSVPIEITAQVKHPSWTWFAVGPGGAVVLPNGTLAVPATHASGTRPTPGAQDRSVALLSHDGGRSWRTGGDAAPGTNEATLAPLPDGGLLLNARTVTKPGGRRTLQRSADGGLSWGAAWAGMAEPQNRRANAAGCHGAMLAVPRRGGASPLVFFVGPAPRRPTRRANLTLHWSADGGASWPHSLVLHEGPAGYASLAHMPDAAGGDIGVLFEGGKRKEHYAKRVLFAALSGVREAAISERRPARTRNQGNY